MGVCAYWLLKTKEIADSLADRTAVLRVQAEGSRARPAASPDVPPRFWEPDRRRPDGDRSSAEKGVMMSPDASVPIGRETRVEQVSIEGAG